MFLSAGRSRANGIFTIHRSFWPSCCVAMMDLCELVDGRRYPIDQDIHNEGCGEQEAGDERRREKRGRCDFPECHN